MFLAASLIAGTSLLYVAAASPEPPREPSEIEQLKNEVTALRQRVETLEKRLADRSIIIPKDNGRQGPIVIEPPTPTRKGWRPFEFNGMQFYVVPIDGQHADLSPGP